MLLFIVVVVVVVEASKGSQGEIDETARDRGYIHSGVGQRIHSDETARGAAAAPPSGACEAPRRCGQPIERRAGRGE